jgi:outer membrane protein assembly factor BamB
MSIASRNSVFAAIAGQVVALDRATGAELWRTRLRLSGGVSLIGDGRHLYASSQGQICCLDPATGAILWRNPLRGLGVGPVALWAPITEAPRESGTPELTPPRRRPR